MAKKVKINKSTKSNKKSQITGAIEDRWLRLTIGLGAILIGILVLISPETSLLIASIMVGLLALLKSISGIYTYYSGKKEGVQFFLLLDVILLVVGLTCLMKPDFFLQILAYILAVWMLVEGLTNLDKIRRLKPAKRKLKTIDAVINAIIIIASLILVLFPNLIGLSISIIAGIILIMFGTDSVVRGLGLFDND